MSSSAAELEERERARKQRLRAETAKADAERAEREESKQSREIREAEIAAQAKQVERTELLEREVEAMHARHAARDQEKAEWANNYAERKFAHLVGEVGLDLARAAFQSAIPNRRRGNPGLSEHDQLDRQVIRLTHENNIELIRLNPENALTMEPQPGSPNEKSLHLLRKGGSDIPEGEAGLRALSRLPKREAG